MIAGCTTLILTLLIQLPLVQKILGEKYSDTYSSAYQDILINHVNRTVDEFGPVILILAIIGIIMVLNFCTTYIFRTVNIPILTQANKYCKFKYENFDELERLIADLDKEIICSSYR